MLGDVQGKLKLYYVQTTLEQEQNHGWLLSSRKTIRTIRAVLEKVKTYMEGSHQHSGKKKKSVAYIKSDKEQKYAVEMHTVRVDLDNLNRSPPLYVMPITLLVQSDCRC